MFMRVNVCVAVKKEHRYDGMVRKNNKNNKKKIKKKNKDTHGGNIQPIHTFTHSLMCMRRV